MEKYQNSDLTVSQFARERGILASTLKGWINKETDIRFGELQTEENTRTAMLRPNKVFITENIRIECEAYDETADYIYRNIKKDDLIFIEGTIMNKSINICIITKC